MTWVVAITIAVAWYGMTFICFNRWVSTLLAPPKGFFRLYPEQAALCWLAGPVLIPALLLLGASKWLGGRACGGRDGGGNAGID